MAKPVTGQHTQITDNKPADTWCLCVPFVAIGRLIRNALASVADFFRHLCSSIRTLPPERVTPPPITSSKSQARCPSSDLIRFYKAGLKTDNNFTLSFLLEEANDTWLEVTHFWVQWAFPLKEPSGFTPTAPILDEETIAQFQGDAELQANLLKMFHRALRFFGLTLQEGTIVESENFAQRSIRWNRNDDHNHLRLTRILKCLKLLQAPSAPSWSEALFRCLKGIQEKYNKISPADFAYWQAVYPDIK